MKSEFFEFEIEREIRLVNREKAGGGSKRENQKSMGIGDKSMEDQDKTEQDLGGTLEYHRDQEEPKNPNDPENVGSQLDHPIPKKGD